tara:strand:- start:47 stop:430 length:384 start_codon:yes stop_codon:yes gene_type:complete
MENYFYIRDVADEASDTNASSSVMVPMSGVTAIAAGTAITELDVHYYDGGKNESRNSFARLTVTRGKLKQVTAAITAAMNSRVKTGKIVLADVCTTSDGASSIDGNDQTKVAKFLHPDITGVQILVG